MHIRATRVQFPPDQTQQAIKNFETNILPAVRKAPGNVGGVLLVNRQSGEAIGVTYWESGKAMGAAEDVGISSRAQSAKNVPGAQILNVERAEIMIMDRAAAPKAGTFVRSISGSGDPDKLDAGVSIGRTKALPVLKSLKGYRAFLVAVDRQTGRTLVSSVWDTKQDLDASESKLAGIRQEFVKAAGINPQTLKVEIFEGAVVELATVAAAQTTRA